MASGYTFKATAPAECLAGSSAVNACTSAGGASWNLLGDTVCSWGGVTYSIGQSVPCNTSDWSSQVIPPLNLESANALFLFVVAMFGLAYIFRLAYLLILNK